MNDKSSLPVHGATQVDVWGTRDGIDGIAGVEFDHLLVGQLERCGTVSGRLNMEDGFQDSRRMRGYVGNTVNLGSSS